MNTNHVKRITRQLGDDLIESELKVKNSSLRAARALGLFPARWYGPLKKLCDDRGIPIPLCAFTWIGVDKKAVKETVGAEVASRQPILSDKATIS